MPAESVIRLPLANAEGLLDELMVSNEGVLQVRLPGSPFNVAGIPAMLGPAFLPCESTQVRNRAEIEKHIGSGSPDPIPVALPPCPGTRSRCTLAVKCSMRINFPYSPSGSAPQSWLGALAFRHNHTTEAELLTEE